MCYISIYSICLVLYCICLFCFIWLICLYLILFDSHFISFDSFVYLSIHSVDCFRLCRCSQGSVYWLFLTSQMNFSRDPQQQENNHRQEGDENPSSFQTSNMSAKTLEIIIEKRRITIKTLNLLILSGASLLHHHPITTLWSRFATVSTWWISHGARVPSSRGGWRAACGWRDWSRQRVDMWTGETSDVGRKNYGQSRAWAHPPETTTVPRNWRSLSKLAVGRWCFSFLGWPMFRGELFDSGRMRHFEKHWTTGGLEDERCSSHLRQVDPRVSLRKKPVRVLNGWIFPKSCCMEVEKCWPSLSKKGTFFVTGFSWFFDLRWDTAPPSKITGMLYLLRSQNCLTPVFQVPNCWFSFFSFKKNDLSP